MKRLSWIPVFVLLAAMCFGAGLARPAEATVYHLVGGAPYAAASFAEHDNSQAYLGSGAWSETYPAVGDVFQMYISPAQFGTSFTVGDIQSITYHTINGATNPSDVDFYLKIYTEPYVGGDASWYGNRLNAEPLYSNSYVGPSAWVWNTWTTDSGTNQLTFFDSNHCGNLGFYGGATLQDLTGGSITWSSYAGAGATAETTPIDYASQVVKYLNFSTGSGWASFHGYIDAITVALTNGDSYVIDLESTTDPTYVDDDWAGTAPGVEVASGKFFGYNAFDNIQDGIDYVSGSTVYVAAGHYPISTPIVCNIPVELSGPQAGVDPRPSAASSRTPGDTLSEAVVDGGYSTATLLTVAADDVVMDGLEFTNGTGDLVASSASAPIKYRTQVRNCIIHDSSGDEGMQLRNVTDGTVERNLVYNTAGDGINMCCGTTGSTIQDNEVRDIDSDNGAIYMYETTNMLVQRNLVYNTSQNDGIKMGAKGGADADSSGGQILDNVIHDTDQDGISIYTSDVEVCGNEIYGSTSENGAFYVAFNVDNVQVTKNRIHDNGSTMDARTTYGIRVGRGSYHPTNVLIHDNDVKGNEEGLFNNNATGPALNAESNWWGDASGPSGDGSGTGDSITGGNVDFTPWRLMATGVTACSGSPVDNPVTPDPADSCLTAATPCNTVSFDITRSECDWDACVQRDLPAEQRAGAVHGEPGRHRGGDVPERRRRHELPGAGQHRGILHGGRCHPGTPLRGDRLDGGAVHGERDEERFGVGGGYGNHHRDLGDVPGLLERSDSRDRRWNGDAGHRHVGAGGDRRPGGDAGEERERVGRDDEHRSVLERGDGAGRGHDRDLPRRLRLLSGVRRRGRVGAGDAELSAVGGVDPGGDGGGDRDELLGRADDAGLLVLHGVREGPVRERVGGVEPDGWDAELPPGRRGAGGDGEQRLVELADISLIWASHYGISLSPASATRSTTWTWARRRTTAWTRVRRRTIRSSSRI